MPVEVFGDIEFVVGNIDADPLFSDPDGADDDPATVEDNDYRLRAGSPCIDSGSTLLVPPDLPDLNGNLDYAERLPLALDGVSRRIFDDVNTPDTGVNDPPDYHPVVDMGAYEVLNLFRPPDPADPPHDCRKNRYISFTPSMGLNTVAYRVYKIPFQSGATNGLCVATNGSTGVPCTGAAATGAPTQNQGSCPSGQLCIRPYVESPGGSCWVQAPVLAGTPDEYTARCDATPVYRVWTEPVIHVGGCEIIPATDYRITTVFDGFDAPTSLFVSTIALPNKYWGDVVGAAAVGGVWPCPQGVVNAADITAVVSIPNNTGTKPPFTYANLQGMGTDDPCLNAMVNSADVQAVILAAQGKTYAAPDAPERFTDPACCPPCPCSGAGCQSACPEQQGFDGGGDGMAGGGMEMDGLTFTPMFRLSVDPYQINAEDEVTVVVSLDSVAQAFGAYEVSLEVTGGGSGGLTREAVDVDDQQGNFLFYGHGIYEVANAEANMVGAVEANGQGVSAWGERYLATFTFLASTDAHGVFEVRVSDERSFLLDGDGRQTAHDASAVAYVRVDVECTDAAHCDDGNPCTGDACVSDACVNTNLSSGTPCDDGLYCTVTDTCDGSGACTGTGSPCAKPNPRCCESTDSCHPDEYECPL